MNGFKRHIVELIVALLSLTWIFTNAVISSKQSRKILALSGHQQMVTPGEETDAAREHPMQDSIKNEETRYAFISKRNIFSKDGCYKNRGGLENLPPLKTLLKKRTKSKKQKRKPVKVVLLGILYDGQVYHAVIQKNGKKVSFVDEGDIIADGVEISDITENKLVIKERGKKKIYRLFNFSLGSGKKTRNPKKLGE